MKKVFLALLVVLTICIIAVTCSICSNAEESDFEYLVLSSSSAELTGYRGEERDIVIPDAINGYSITRIADGAFAFSDITSVVIPDEVTVIGQRAFYKCKSLKTFNFPESLRKIGAKAFAGTGIESLDLSNQHFTADVYVFSYCSQLESVKLQYRKSVTWGNGAFMNCTSLKEIDFSGNPALGISMFLGCTALEEIDVPMNLNEFSDDTDETTQIRSVFSGCTSLKRARINTGLWTCKYMFEECNSLEELIINNPRGGESVIEGASLYNCSSLKKIIFTGEYKDTETFQGGGINAERCVLDTENGFIYNNSYYKETGMLSVVYAIPSYDTEILVLPENTELIADDAFNGCRIPRVVILSDNVVISLKAFSGDIKSIIYCNRGSEAEKYCRRCGLAYRLLDEYNPYDFSQSEKQSETPIMNKPNFTDVDEGAWYTEAVIKAASNRYMTGYGNGFFGPSNYVTRAMLVTALSSLSGTETSIYSESSYFEDVNANAWYTGPLEWAYQNRITIGIGEDKCSPDSPVTRAEAICMLAAYAKNRDSALISSPTDTLNDYHDSYLIPEWANRQISWAVFRSVAKGYNQYFRPNSYLTRAEMAVILQMYINTKQVSE